MAAIWTISALLALSLACDQAPRRNAEDAAPPAPAAATPPPAQPMLPLGSPTPAPETSFLAQSPFAGARIPPETHYVPPAAYISQKVIQKVGESVVNGRVYRPDNPKGAVLVIHEWWGLNAQMDQIAQEIAGWNYLTLAIDLYGDKVAANRGEAASLARGLDPQNTMKTLEAAVAWLGDTATTVSLPVAVVGWSWGGTLGLRLATEEPRLKAVAVSDAQPLADRDLIRRIQAPVLAFFCMRGGSLTRQEVDAFTTDLMQLSSHKPQVLKFSTEPGTLLAPKGLQDEAYAKTARQRLRQFLDKNLAPEQ
ncbi:MAG: alpha/beta fold hydrolase [Candidatus Sumerlaeia bacterium]